MSSFSTESTDQHSRTATTAETVQADPTGHARRDSITSVSYQSTTRACRQKEQLQQLDSHATRWPSSDIRRCGSHPNKKPRSYLKTHACNLNSTPSMIYNPVFGTSVGSIGKSPPVVVWGKTFGWSRRKKISTLSDSLVSNGRQFLKWHFSLSPDTLDQTVPRHCRRLSALLLQFAKFYLIIQNYIQYNHPAQPT
ncbi:1-deoxy-D-xylulose 5-phosphate reductoisomerase [Trichinella pseudospiralis]